MIDIAGNVRKLCSELPSGVVVVAVSKTKPVEEIMVAYDAGHRIFGENRVQELVDKQPIMPRDIKWHMIGHLQTNKVKYIAGFVEMIHSVDSLKLLGAIDKEAAKAGRKIKCLLQFHIAKEDTKFGFSYDEVATFIEGGALDELSNIELSGVMGMATFTEDLDLVRSEFRQLKDIFDKLKTSFFLTDNSFREISMGMSGDYQVAIEEGSTIIRVGNSIFGERNYQSG
ncbi:MAG TPA: YggS family pyridoxal phosphate-dependent enzyme [Bacteroidales bacterium]|nr:YggS family pyridoxal phosphate-dependent enzyme [Bacteroidales bacterium]